MSDKKSLALAMSWGLALAIGWGASSYANQEEAVPQAVKDAIKSAFPNATVGEVEEEGIEVAVYEVKLRDGNARIELLIGADGTLIEVERMIAAKDLPPAVAATITRESAGGGVGKVERVEVRARPQLVALQTPEVMFEAYLTKDGKKRELMIGADGAVLAVEEEDDGDEEEGD